MTATKIHWCAHCAQTVAPTFHDVTESTKFDGETTWEALIEKRCPVCARQVEERIEQQEGAAPPRDVSVEDIFKDGLAALRFTAMARVDQIARACMLFSTDTHEVVAQIMVVNGKPVVALRREPRPAGLAALLRPGSEEPLSFLARRQAS